ncbi:hypothetical protein AVEN_256225-1 [Araneus ventricosus]|uniref:Uncharacterized protein n=1 Tax=Araneus ventricosus TaxID=182803 RepID=A0A4Y2LRQ0_ARAVE|nr:hypothetical protein AVEN_256225-1 [Araneus ventricosus]
MCIRFSRTFAGKSENQIRDIVDRTHLGLRNKVKEWRGKGVTIGGRNRGKLERKHYIKKLTNFYRKAIKDDVPDMKMMKIAIHASLSHSSSTDKAPKHNKCPTSLTSWCFYQRALANNKKPKSHSSMMTKLSEQVLEKYC